MKKSLATLALLAFPLSLVLPVAPATAAIDAGQKLMAIGCGGANQGKFYDINPNDGTAVTVGAGHTEPGANCSNQGAFSPIDGLVFYIQGGASPVAVLVRTDKTTGIHETIGQLQSPTNEPRHMASLAINSSGEAFGFDPSENFYSIDLTSGVATLVGSNATTMAAFYLLAFDPVTGIMYAVLGGSFSPVLQTVNILTGAPTSTGVTLPHYVMGITVDEDGLMWVLTNDVMSEVRSYAIGTNTWSPKGLLTLGGTNVYSQSMFFYGTVGGLPTDGDMLSKKFSVYFDGNSAKLTKAAKRAIVRKLNSLGDGAAIDRVIIKSYIAGSVTWEDLAVDRVRAVKNFLAKGSVTPRAVREGFRRVRHSNLSSFMLTR